MRAVAALCGRKAIGVWCWWIYRRSDGLCGCGGGNGAGRVRTGVCAQVVHRARPQDWSRTGVVDIESGRRVTVQVGGRGRSARRGRLGVGLWVAYSEQRGRPLGRCTPGGRHRSDRRRSELWASTRSVVGAERLATKVWCTSVVDVGGRHLIDIVGGRTADSAVSWFRSQLVEWLDGIRWAVPGHVRALSEGVRPGVAVRCAGSGPLRCHILANQRHDLDEESKTKPSERGPDDPLYRIRRLLTAASRGSATAVKHGCVVSSTLVTPTATAPPGTRRKRSEASTGSTVPPSLSGTPSGSGRPPGRMSLPTRDQQVGSHHRPLDPPDHQLAHLEGNQRTHRSPQQPHQSGSNEQRSGYPTSRTTESAQLLYAGKPNWDLLATVTPH